MAGIDKTYTSSYKEYKEFKDWADTQFITFFNGHKVCVGDYVWELEEGDFRGSEIPIMNTPTFIDAYFVRNCKAGFVIERMESVYNNAHYNELLDKDYFKLPKDYQQYRKIKIVCDEDTKFPKHNKPYVVKGRSKWWLQCDGLLGYDSESKTWADYDIYPHDTNTAMMPSIKAIIKHLRKQYLPKGATFRILGNYVGEHYKAITL